MTPFGAPLAPTCVASFSLCIRALQSPAESPIALGSSSCSKQSEPETSQHSSKEQMASSWKFTLPSETGTELLFYTPPISFPIHPAF